MKVPDAWNARQDQLTRRGHCAICGKITKRGDHTACSMEGERRHSADGSKPAKNREKHYATGRLPKWMFS
jgi:hypothetical protein